MIMVKNDINCIYFLLENEVICQERFIWEINPSMIYLWNGEEKNKEKKCKFCYKKE